MFHKAQIKLTIFYSLLFLFTLWIFSGGIYLWMERSFGENYIGQVQERQSQQQEDEDDFEDHNQLTAVIAGDLALERLAKVLLALNAISLLMIPAFSWYLARKNLAPIKAIHEKQKQFVSDASHELRTPLSIMTTEIDIALKKNRKISEYKSALRSNKEELSRLSKLVENLLFLAREDKGVFQDQLEKIDLTDILSGIVMQVKPLCSQKQIDLHYKPADESIEIMGFKTLIYQLFFNIIDNAIKYTNEGFIEVKITKHNGIVKVFIKDTGIGISLNNQEKLFDRFYRVDMARSETKGYGLGLAICESIAKRHRGSIDVRSSFNNGSTFVVSLPIK